MGLEGGNFCITFASGCGATASIMHTLKSGDHVIVCDDVYGGTQRYLRVFSDLQYGVKADFVDLSNIEKVKNAIKKETKLVWI